VRGEVTHRSHDQAGAAAVEFALVSVVLFLLLFGILQYGLFFNDSLNARQGVREGARQAVVENFAFASACTSGSNSEKIRCSTRDEIGAITGKAYVKVAAKTLPWKQGDAVTVCALVHTNGAVGVLPMPNGGWIRSRTQMAIEQQAQSAQWTDSADDLSGTGQDWTWCTS
jgi:hypothetical protein